MDQAWVAILGTVVGGGISLGTAWWIEARKERRIGMNVSIAAASELDAVLMILKARDWRGNLNIAADAAKKGQVVPFFFSTMRDDYLPMCREALRHAGSIDPRLAILLARAIVLADGLIADVRSLHDRPMGTQNSLLQPSMPEMALKLFTNMVEIIDAGFSVGGQVIALVDSIYPMKREARAASKTG